MPDTRLIYGDLHDLPSAVDALSGLPPEEGPVLSIFLDTSVTRVPGRDYLILFRDAARTIREGLSEHSTDELKAFGAAVEQAELFLLHQFSPQHPGLALFVAADPGFLLAVPLPDRPAQDVTWGETPLIAPLIEFLDDYERVAVALLDKQQARLFTVFLGAIEWRDTVESPSMGKRSPGDWPRRVRSSTVRQGRYTPGTGGTIAWSGMGQGRQRRRHKSYVEQHVRDVAGALMDMLRERPFDRLVLGGPEEAVVMLRDNLPRPLQARYAASRSMPVNAKESDILAEVASVGEELEREEEQALVQRLVERAGAEGAVLGLESTVEAINQGRVERLLIASAAEFDLSACGSCGALTTSSKCPLCGSIAEPVADGRESLIRSVLDQSGRIEMVSGEAARLLCVHGGVGGFVWYSFEP